MSVSKTQSLKTLLNLDCPEHIALEMLADINLAEINHQALFSFNNDETDKATMAYCFLHDLNKKQIHKSDSFIILEAIDKKNGMCSLSFNHITVENLNELKKTEICKELLNLKKGAIREASNYKNFNDMLSKLVELTEADKKEAGMSYAY